MAQAKFNMKTTNNVKKWSQATRAAMNKNLAATAFQVQAGAANTAPVDTGALKNSIQAREANASKWLVEDGVTYGIFQELGTSRSTAKHFLGRATEAAFSDFQKRMMTILQETKA